MTQIRMTLQRNSLSRESHLRLFKYLSDQQSPSSQCFNKIRWELQTNLHYYLWTRGANYSPLKPFKSILGRNVSNSFLNFFELNVFWVFNSISWKGNFEGIFQAQGLTVERLNRRKSFFDSSSLITFELFKYTTIKKFLTSNVRKYCLSMISIFQKVCI